MKWISMLAPSKQMFGKYKTLVVKMIDDVVINASIHTKYERVWCENSYGINVCVAYVGSSTKIDQTCSKQGNFHM
jgi:hypothetical protein